MGLTDSVPVEPHLAPRLHSPYSLLRHTQRSDLPCGDSLKTPLKLTLVPESTHQKWCKATPALRSTMLNLY